MTAKTEREMTPRLEAAIKAVRLAITNAELSAATDELKYAYAEAPLSR